MDELNRSEPVARRVGRFFADLMVTLPRTARVAPSRRMPSAPCGRTGRPATIRPAWALDAETLVHGLGAVAVALVEEVVAARRAAGATDVTVTDIWLEVGRALEPERLDAVGSGGGVIDLPWPSNGLGGRPRSGVRIAHCGSASWRRRAAERRA